MKRRLMTALLVACLVAGLLAAQHMRDRRRPQESFLNRPVALKTLDVTIPDSELADAAYVERHLREHGEGVEVDYLIAYMEEHGLVIRPGKYVIMGHMVREDYLAELLEFDRAEG